MLPRRIVTLALALVATFALTAPVKAEAQRQVISVKDDAQLRQALRQLGPGVTVSIAPGNYRGGLWIEGAHGSADAPIIVEGADPLRPPVLIGGGSGMQFSAASHLVLRNMIIRGATGNGINIDDGGKPAAPSHHIVLEDLTVADTGPQGNTDGIKLSGLDGFVVRRCTVEGWGGSGVDMVGCRNGVIESCQFLGKEAFSTSNGVQAKGGTRDILIHRSFFRDCGNRAINLGGSTGLQFFRPAVGDFEARDIEVAGNRFVGGLSSVAFVTSQGGRVHRNTIYLPGRWGLRILQETQDPRFGPSGTGVFEHNLIVYNDQMGTFVNIGPGTAAESFTFRGNAWFSLGRVRTPDLPARETDGLYQIDPQLIDAGLATMRIGSQSPRFADVGADAYVEAVRQADSAAGQSAARRGSGE